MSPLQALWMVHNHEPACSAKARNSESLLKGRGCWEKKVSESPATEGGSRSAPDTQKEKRV